MPYARDQYAGALEFSDATIENVPDAEDQERVKAYQFYEDTYHNRPETFRISMRGDDEDQKAIYVPSAKIAIEATNRFLAVNYDIIVDPSAGNNDRKKYAEARAAISNLWKRERMRSKFNNQRRYGLIRGDALFHVTADEAKEDGKRISIHELNPAHYFPIEDPNDTDRIVGCHIVDTVPDPNDKEGKKQVARRQTYRKVLDNEGKATGKITSELTLFTLGKWDDRQGEDDLEQVQVLTPEFELPDPISEIPVYHWRNNIIPGATFGNSEVVGMERLISAMNQSLTDEDATLVMQGLGMYTTDAGPPENEDGSPAEWEIGPGQVVEVGEGQNFNRVTGVSSVAPMQDHIRYMQERVHQAAGVPEIAAGKVDVGLAESGISLRLQLMPIISKNKEKEDELLSIMDHMLYDLASMWFPAYERMDFSEINISSTVDDPLPQNREAKIQEIMLLFTSGIITIQMAQAELAKFGYSFKDNDDQQALADAAALAAAKSGDPFANRYATETAEDIERGMPQGKPTGGQPNNQATNQAGSISNPSGNLNSKPRGVNPLDVDQSGML